MYEHVISGGQMLILLLATMAIGYAMGRASVKKADRK